MCCATPLFKLHDPALAVRTEGAERAAINSYVGCIDALERLTEDLIRLKVSMPAGERIIFAAGQYINIVLTDGQRRAYSLPTHHKTTHASNCTFGAFQAVASRDMCLRR